MKLFFATAFVLLLIAIAGAAQNKKITINGKVIPFKESLPLQGANFTEGSLELMQYENIALEFVFFKHLLFIIQLPKNQCKCAPLHHLFLRSGCFYEIFPDCKAGDI